MRGGGYKVVQGPLFSGSYSRFSLCIVNDVPKDCDLDFSQIVLCRDDLAVEDGGTHLEYDESSCLEKHWHFYDTYFAPFESIEGVGEGSLLLVSDSMGQALARLLGLRYAEIVWVDSLHQNSTSDMELKNLIEEYDIDDVLFVGAVIDYHSFLNRHPNYFF